MAGYKRVFDFPVRGVHKYLDGDNIHLVVDRGFRDFSVQNVRFVTVQAPERGLPGSVEATAFVIDWFTVRTNRLRVRTYAEDGWMRWLGDVYVSEPTDVFRLGETISEALLAAGLVSVYTKR